MADDGLDEAFDALNARFASELVIDEETKLQTSMAALRALAEDNASDKVPSSDDDEDELGRVLAALKLEVSEPAASDDEPELTIDDGDQDDGDQDDGDQQILLLDEVVGLEEEEEVEEEEVEEEEAAAEAEEEPDLEPEAIAVDEDVEEPQAIADIEEAEEDLEPEAIADGEDNSTGEDDSAVEPEAFVEPEPDQVDPEIPPFLRDWTHSTDEHQILADLFPSMDEPIAEAAATEPDLVSAAAIASGDPEGADLDDGIPSFLSTEEHDLLSPAVLSPAETAPPVDDAFADAYVPMFAAGDTDPSGLAGSRPIVPVGAARLQPEHVQPTFEEEIAPDQILEPVIPVATEPPARSRPPSPWGPRIAAGAGITMLIAGSAVLWVTLLGSPRSSSPTSSDATAITTTLPVQATAVVASGAPTAIDRGRVTISDARLEAEITRCDMTGMTGHISTSGAEWVTTSIQAQFVSAAGQLLTESNPVQEVVPTTIRVPFTFDYEPSLAPAGLEGEEPWCEVTLDIVPGS